MTGQEPTNQEEPAGIDALRALINEGGWRPLPAPEGLLVIMHVHPDGSVDTLNVGVHGEHEAKLERSDPANRLVARETGSLLEMVTLARELPPPGHPDAPVDPIQPKPLDLDRLIKSLGELIDPPRLNPPE